METRVYECKQDEHMVCIMAALICRGGTTWDANNSVEIAQDIVKTVRQQIDEEDAKFNEEPYWMDKKETP